MDSVVKHDSDISTSFELTEPFHLYYRYRGAVDPHKAKTDSLIPIEETWATKTWEHMVLAPVLTVFEVNTISGQDEQIWS